LPDEPPIGASAPAEDRKLKQARFFGTVSTTERGVASPVTSIGGKLQTRTAIPQDALNRSTNKVWGCQPNTVRFSRLHAPAGNELTIRLRQFARAIEGHRTIPTKNASQGLLTVGRAAVDFNRSVARLAHEWSEPLWLDRFQAGECTSCRACRSSNCTGGKYPSAECNLRVL
jgi:hypothetical protein